jgi:hypothetical protein
MEGKSSVDESFEPLLFGLTLLAERGVEVGVTLLVGGVIVSGKIISRQAYGRGVTAQIHAVKC